MAVFITINFEKSKALVVFSKDERSHHTQIVIVMKERKTIPLYGDKLYKI